jgi:hypothetical protein
VVPVIHPYVRYTVHQQAFGVTVQQEITRQQHPSFSKFKYIQILKINQNQNQMA